MADLQADVLAFIADQLDLPVTELGLAAASP
jgi:hypothetical protein